MIKVDMDALPRALAVAQTISVTVILAALAARLIWWYFKDVWK